MHVCVRYLNAFVTVHNAQHDTRLAPLDESATLRQFCAYTKDLMGRVEYAAFPGHDNMDELILNLRAIGVLEAEHPFRPLEEPIDGDVAPQGTFNVYMEHLFTTKRNSATSPAPARGFVRIMLLGLALVLFGGDALLLAAIPTTAAESADMQACLNTPSDTCETANREELKTFYIITTNKRVVITPGP